MSDDMFSEMPSVDGYVQSLGKLGTEFRIERLRRERGELVGELRVECALPGVKSANGVLHVADLNLSSARSRTERARILAERANTADVDWTGLLEEFVQRVIDADRRGRPAVLLRDVPRPPADDSLSIGPGLSLLRRHPTILFGDGGDAKSYLALYAATCLAAAGMRVLYVDFEFAGEDHRDRLERITGPAMPDLWYVRAERPMTAESDRLRRIVREEHIDYVIVDSVAFACDGPPEAAEVAGRYFQALRRLGVGSLNVAHITKADGGDQKPFGSTFWHNGARSSWFIKRASETDGPVLEVGLFNRKSNIGPRARAVGYRVTFGADSTTFDRIEVGDTALADKLPVAQRMAALLGSQGAMTMVAIAGALDVPVDTIVKTTKRHEGKRFVRIPGSDNVYRIGLVAS